MRSLGGRLGGFEVKGYEIFGLNAISDADLKPPNLPNL